MPRTEEREKGLYKNGSRWWMRVKGEPRSTGTEDLVLANRVKRMVDELLDDHRAAEWIERVLANEITLLDLYKHRAAGSLPAFRAQLAVKQTDDADADLDPWVTKWVKEHLPTLDISEGVRVEYARQVRLLIPAGKRFPKSKFTEDNLKDALNKLTDARTGGPLSSSTRRRYFAAWKLFYRFAKKRVPLDVNPFDEPDWMPANNSPRSVHWDHATTLDVLGRMEGEARVVMTLIFGSGGELGPGRGRSCARRPTASSRTSRCGRRWTSTAAARNCARRSTAPR
jgi:hypothetical protein